MKIHCIVVSVAAYISLETTLAAESGGYTSKVNKVHGDEAATIKERMDGIKLAEGNGHPKEIPEAPAAAAAANHALASCSDDDSFSLSEFSDGSYDGCYSEIIVSDDTWFSLNGELEDGLFYYPTELVPGYSYWSYATAVINTDTDTVFLNDRTCYDSGFGDVSTTHPSEVTNWTCDTSSVTDSNFALECGCNSAPSSLLLGGALATALLALLGANLLLVW